MNQAVMVPRQVKPGRPRVADPKRSIASFRGGRAFSRWFEQLRRQERATGAAMLEKALVHYAQSRGYSEPPAR
jgi:hypothetical protein